MLIHSRRLKSASLVAIFVVLAALSFPAFLNRAVPSVAATSNSFTFAASGDIASLTSSTGSSILSRLGASGVGFFLGLGNMSYNSTLTGDAWCSQFKAQENNIEIIPGDHDTGGHNSATFGETHSYERYVNNCSLTLGVPIVCGPVAGDCYGKEYYFDYPTTNPLARFIFTAPKIYNITGVCTSSPNCSSQTGQPCTDQYGCWQYNANDIHYNWTSRAIDDARAKGIGWVIVATHKLCLSSADATCSMGIQFFNMLVQKKVDLIIQAHDNAYERSKQVAFNPTTCPNFAGDGNGYVVYNSGCIVDQGQGNYTRGQGSVVVVQGAWINDLYGVNQSASTPANVAEAAYFAKLMGKNTPGNGLGFVTYTVSPGRIDVQTSLSGSFSDRFSIANSLNPVPLASWTPLAPQVGQSVTFTATATGGTPPYSFSWNFGDGTTASGTTATHSYIAIGTYNVTLSAVDSAGRSGSSRNVIAVGSWNPSVACAPTVSTIEQVIGKVSIQRNSTIPSSIGADYSGGGFKLAGNLPYGSSPDNWPYSKRALTPPCVVNGIPTFVELHNVTLVVAPQVATYDCRNFYNAANGGARFPNGQNCDIVFNIGNASATTCPSCYMHRLYSEIDGDWNASSVAPTAPPFGQAIDVQGFVYWDPDADNLSSHNWSGWELHSFTAWRLTPKPNTPPTVTVGSATPNPTNTGSTVSLSFAISSSTPLTSVTVNWGDGTAIDSLPVSATSDSHVYAGTGTVKSQSFTITVTATNSAGSGKGSTTETVDDRPPTVVVNSISPNPVLTGSTVTASFSGSDTDGTVSSFSVNWGDGTAADILPGTATSDTHSYSSAGTFTVTITATDNSGSTGQGSGSITVQSPKAPTVSVNSPTPNPANTGATVTVSFTVSSSKTVTGITVNWGDGSAVDSLAGTATSDTHAYLSTGSLTAQTFTIIVTATSSAGSGSGSTTETVNDQPPTVSISNVSPNPALTGSTVTVGFAATDPDGTISSLKITWGDGSTPTTLSGSATSATHVYASTGNAMSQTFSITITATDNGGSTGSATSTVVVNDQPPSIAVSNVSPNPASTGQLVTVTFSATDSDGTVSSIVINWGDGTASTSLAGTATSATHSYSSTGNSASQSFTISLTATDNSGSSASTNVLETVSDRSPVVNVNGATPNPALIGQTVNVTFSTNDPDGTVNAISVNWGDGTTPDSLPGSVTSDSHAYASIGPFTINITATDNNGSAGSGTTSETVTSPLAPTVSITSLGPDPSSTGQSVTVTFSVSSTIPVSSIAVTWGDGTAADNLPVTATSDTHVYASTGNVRSLNFTVTITATNSAGTGFSSAAETVNDQIPRITIGGVAPNPVSTGSTITITFNATDLDGSVTGITVSWGDSSATDNLAGSATSDTHSYASTGSVVSRTFTITVTVTDNSGSTGSASTSETVNDRSPSITITGISPNPAITGQSVIVTFSATDVDGTVSSISVNWGDGSAVHNLASSATTDSHSYLTAGNFTITVVAMDNSGSTAQASIVVSVKTAPAAPYALSTTSDGRIYKTYANGTMVLVGQPVTTQLRSVSWRPDGSYALISGDSAVLLKYDGTTLTTIPTGVSTGLNLWSVSWKPDGSYALIAGTSGLLLKYNGVSVTTVTDPNTLTIFAVSWNPSGSSALLVGHNGIALTYDGTTIRTLTSGTAGDLDAIGWNPNGQYALIGGVNGTVLRFDGTSISTLNVGGIGGTNEVKSIAFNSQGTLALLVGDNGMILSYNGATLTKVSSSIFNWLYTVTWGPNGTAYIEGNSSCLATYSNGTVTKLTGVPTASFRAMAWKPQ